MHKNNAVNLKIIKKISKQRFCFFLIAWLLMFSGEIFAQKKSPEITEKSSLQGTHLQYVAAWDQNAWRNYLPILLKSGLYEKQRTRLPIHFKGELRPATVTVINHNQQLSWSTFFRSNKLPSYTDQLGFFCKKELQLDRLTVVPLRFRLGSLEYVNWMERKQNALPRQ